MAWMAMARIWTGAPEQMQVLPMYREVKRFGAAVRGTVTSSSRHDMKEDNHNSIRVKKSWEKAAG